MKKISSIEALRGLLCIGVFFFHYKGAFFHDSKVVDALMKTPANIIFSGNIPVRLMFVISGLVLALKYLKKDYSRDVLPDLVKRYFRLGIPVFFAVMFSYMLMIFGRYYNVAVAEMTGSQDFLGAFNTFTPSLALAIKEGVYGALFLNSNAYVGPMWTMTYEMFGSVLVICASTLLRSNIAYRVIFYAIFLLLFQCYYPYFIIGMIIADFVLNSGYERNWDKRKTRINTALLVVSGLYICNPIFPDTSRKTYWLFTLACLIFFPCLFRCQKIEEYLSRKERLVTWLGKNSYAFYLLHWPIIESVSCRVFMRLYNGSNYKAAALMVLVITLPVTFLASEVMNRLIEQIGAIKGNSAKKVLSEMMEILPVRKTQI